MLSEVFWTFVVSSIAGFSLAALRMVYKSKCSHVSCCGVSIDRNTHEEAVLDERKGSEDAVPPSPSFSRSNSMVRV